MKHIISSAIFILFFIIASTCIAQKVPSEVGGFALGSDVNDYPDVMNTNFLKEMVVTDRHGFRKGVISYGICQYTDKILKIQLKYEDRSKEYFKKLLKRYKKEYGPPHEWKGDSFGILHVWKWHFVDEEKREVSLVLQHNLRNPNETIGNMVKLTYPTMIEDERVCFNQMCEEMKNDHDKQLLEDIKKPDWEYLIPR